MMKMRKKVSPAIAAAVTAAFLWQVPAGHVFSEPMAGQAAVQQEMGNIGIVADSSAFMAGLTNNYTLKLFGEDTVLKNPNDRETRYLYLAPGNHIADGAVLDLWYTYSPTTKDNLSMMTIAVNGVPVSSRQLAGQAGAESNWQIPLPAKYLKAGFNAISVEVVHRTIDGLCRDIDDPANWFIIRPETKVNFQLIRAPYSLASFPNPFFDDYDAARTNTVFYLPEKANEKVLSSLMGLVSSWGAKGITGLPQRLEVRTGEAGQVPANEILLQEGDGSLQLSGLANGFRQLRVQGSADSIANTVNALGRAQVVQTLSGQQMDLSTELPGEPEGNTFFTKSQNKKGYYTLSDLGYQDDLTVAGAFHQKADVEIPRPANYGIGDGSYIELHFRHSPVLDPKKSAVTIYVNDIPVRAQALTPENADKGILKAPIPASELEKPSWKVRFGFYHDLGIIDCSKRYDEVAWSVIEKDSCVYLEPGDAYHDVSWEYFPNDFGVEGQNQLAVTLLLPDNPSSEEMTAAMKLAYYIGQQNRKKIHWQVKSSSSFDLDKAEGAVIALGKNDDAAAWKSFKDILPVLPKNGGGYQREDWVDAAEQSLPSFDICEIGRSKKDHPVYAFLYASPERLDQMVNHMIDKGNTLKGQVSLVDAQGKAVVYQHPEGPVKKNALLSWIRQLFSGSDHTGGIYIGIVVVTALLTGGLLFIVRRRNR